MPAKGSKIAHVSRRLRKMFEGGFGSPSKGALPDAIIVGAQKSGTTFLHTNLLEHPQVQGALTPEVHFLSNPAGGSRAYRKNFAPREQGKTVVEKSPNLLFFPGTAEAASRLVPQAKIIALLRNPVDRTYSHYHHSKKLGREPLSFEEALEKEPGRIDVDASEVAFRAYSYKAKGRYVEQLGQWLERFPAERVLVMASEEMYADPERIFGEVQRFLGVPERELDTGKGKRHKGRYKEPMEQDTREYLEGYFAPYNKRLYEMMGYNFGW